MGWKKFLCCAIMFLTVAGCGQNKEPAQKALDLRTALLEAGGCTFTAEMQADFSDKTYGFAVACDYTAGDNVRLEILRPEEIAGITATVSGGGAAVEFDGIALDFGTMANGRVSPMEAAWVLCSCWHSAYISAAGKDGELCRTTYLDGFDDKELVIDTWLDESGTPIRGEISYEGVRCLTMDISQFQLKG